MEGLKCCIMQVIDTNEVLFHSADIVFDGFTLCQNHFFIVIQILTGPEYSKEKVSETHRAVATVGAMLDEEEKEAK